MRGGRVEGPARRVVGLYIRRRRPRRQRRGAEYGFAIVALPCVAREGVVQLREGVRAVVDDGDVLSLDGIDALLFRLVRPAGVRGHAQPS
eukprot:330769-Pleurochrysis_carterae.AAC.1